MSSNVGLLEDEVCDSLRMHIEAIAYTHSDKEWCRISLEILVKLAAVRGALAHGEE